MIVHVLEVWAAFVVVFAIGCLGGAALFHGVALRSRRAGELAVAAAQLPVAALALRERLQPPPPPVEVPSPAPREPAARPAAMPEPVAPPVWEVVDQAIAEQSVEGETAEDEAWLSAAHDLEEPYEAGTLGNEADVAAEELQAALETVATPESDEDFADEETADVAAPMAARVNGPPPVARQMPPPPPRAISARPPAGGRTVVHREPPPQLRPRLVAPAQPNTAGGVDGELEIRRPAMLKEPRNGVPDNLTRIRGIGERNEVRLNKLGIFHFSQIAAWTPAEIRWISDRLAFPERIERDDWIGQAIVLASGRETGFTKSAERRRARRRGRDNAGEGTDGETPDEAMPVEGEPDPT